jgi:outer membrane lipoprotein-sorting protein
MRVLIAIVLLTTTAHAAAKKPAPAKTAAPAPAPLPMFAASTAPITLDLIAARFGELDGKLKTLSAGFRQFVRLDGSATSQEVEGTVAFKKPDLLRIVHRIPEPQTVVADGTWLWVHRTTTNQVIQTRLDEWRKKEPLAKGMLDFGHTADLFKKFDAAISTVSATGPDGYRTFSVILTPRVSGSTASESDFKLTLTASTRDFFPADAVLKVGRASIRSVFNDVRFNPDLPDADFHFVTPAGADVFTTPSNP